MIIPNNRENGSIPIILSFDGFDTEKLPYPAVRHQLCIKRNLELNPNATIYFFTFQQSFYWSWLVIDPFEKEGNGKTNVDMQKEKSVSYIGIPYLDQVYSWWDQYLNQALFYRDPIHMNADGYKKIRRHSSWPFLAFPQIKLNELFF